MNNFDRKTNKTNYHFSNFVVLFFTVFFLVHVIQIFLHSSIKWTCNENNIKSVCTKITTNLSKRHYECTLRLTVIDSSRKYCYFHFFSRLDLVGCVLFCLHFFSFFDIVCEKIFEIHVFFFIRNYLYPCRCSSFICNNLIIPLSLFLCICFYYVFSKYKLYKIDAQDKRSEQKIEMYTINFQDCLYAWISFESIKCSCHHDRQALPSSSTNTSQTIFLNLQYLY